MVFSSNTGLLQRSEGRGYPLDSLFQSRNIHRQGKSDIPLAILSETMARSTKNSCLFK
jgi:hypothetical protein